MKYIIAFSLLLFAVPALAEDAPDTYTPHKLSRSIAEAWCQSLASMVLDRESILSISAHTEAKTVGVRHETGGKVMVLYPYRRDGIAFACSFAEVDRGRVRLEEFGHHDFTDEGRSAMTIIKPLQ